MLEYFSDFLVILLLIVLNGVLAMAELAIVSSNRIKVENFAKTRKGARAALHLMDDPGSFLSTIQIGITVIGLVAGAFSGHKFAEPMGLWLNTFSWVDGYGSIVAFSFVVVLMTYVSTVLGELLPKRIAIAKPETVAILIARPIRVLSRIAYPFVVCLDVTTRAVLRLFNQKEVKESTVTEEEIHSIMKQGLDEGAIDNFEHNLFHKVLEFGDREAGVMMTPRINVVYLDLVDGGEINTGKILQNPHRYYPVFEGGLDIFRGIVDAKDVLTQVMQGKPFELRSLVKEVPCVIEGNDGPELLNYFKKHKTHIAIVVDEYGSMQGIITLVDLFEALVGSIPASSQHIQCDVVTRDDGSWLCNGLMPIEEVEELLQLDLAHPTEDADFHTLGGFLLGQFKHVPKEGEHISWNGFLFEIVDMDGSRIDKVLVQRQ